MITFITAVLLLIAGYLCYGYCVEKVFGIQPERQTPCYTHTDGVDYLPMSTWRVFLVQFLNIAGTGPIFGAILGVLFGPAAYLWIVLGCIFGGAVHDYLAGMICLRKDGASLPEFVGDELGSTARFAVRALAIVLMILAGTVFTTTPAGLLSNMIGGDGLLGDKSFWIVIVFAYYILATLLPIDKVIGRVYPIFGVTLLVMAIGVGYGIIVENGDVPEVTEAFANYHPSTTLPIFPGICVTIACGAISGFHATQSPMMARCMTNEKYGRPVFYGSMIAEGFVALIWAAAAIKFAGTFDVTPYGMSNDCTPYEKLWAIMTEGGKSTANPAILVNSICQSWLGAIGAVFAVLGVVAAPITTGDTAFRCARLIASDILHIKNNKIYRRVLMSLPIFGISTVLMFINFDVLWRYFALFNQSFATITLWAIAVWLYKNNKCYWIAAIPGCFMTMVCVSYVLVSPEGFSLPQQISYTVGIIAVIAVAVSYAMWQRKYDKTR